MYFLQTMVSAMLVSIAYAAKNADPGCAIYKGKPRNFTMGIRDEVILSCETKDGIKNFKLSNEGGKTNWSVFYPYGSDLKIGLIVNEAYRPGNGYETKWEVVAILSFENKQARDDWEARLKARFNELQTALQAKIEQIRAVE